MLRNVSKAGLLLTLCAGVGLGQQSQFSAILAGPVFDPPTAGIRMVFGYPGAARINQSVYGGLDDAVMAPDGKDAVALRSTRIVGLRLISGGPVQEIDFGSSASRLQASWSPDGQTAAVWFADSGSPVSFQFWAARQSPQAPVASPFSVDSIQCIRLLPDGDALLAAVKDGERSGIYRVGSNGAVNRIASSDDPLSIALDPAAKLYYYFDRRTLAVLRQSFDGAIPPETVVSDGLATASSPGTLAVLRGRRLALTDSVSKSVFLFSLDTGALLGQLQLEAAPDGLLPLGGSDWLVLSHRHQKTDSLLLLDARSDAVYFVPADDN